jgi:hypothetical protein
MYAPDLSGLFFFIKLVLAVPLLLGVVTTLLAGVEGASAGPHLRAGRRLVAAAAGGLVGCFTFAGAALVGLHAALRTDAGLAGCFLAIFMAAVLGLLVAFLTARATAARLNRYRCAECRERFRAQWPVARCPRCDRPPER